MSRGGANPNWHWQLIAASGHYSDSGLRQRHLVEVGHRSPSAKSAQQQKKRRIIAVAKAAGLTINDLKALFARR